MSLHNFLVALLAGSRLVVTIAGGEPVCYAREQIDDLNVKVKMVPCKENKQPHFKEFTSHKDVAITDLLGVKCIYEELPKVLNGYFEIKDCTGRGIEDTCKVTCNDGYVVSSSMVQTTCQDGGNGYAAWSLNDFSCHKFSCSFDKLPNVTNGYINISDCTGHIGNDVCNVTCEKDYYPAIQQTVCKYAGSERGEWLSTNLSCLAVTCPFDTLPTVINGHFNTTNCTGNLVHDTCDMICNVDYYTTTIKKTHCHNVGSFEGRWTKDNFTCDAITCSFTNFPSVTMGQFHKSYCSGSSVGHSCEMTCPSNYYPSTPKKTRCENVGSNQGSWSSGNFTCQGRCPSGWTGSTRVSGICYKILTNMGTYSQQETKCNGENGHLASIHSLDEVNEIKALLSGDESTFIGLNDISIEGTWVYSDSTSYDYNNWKDGEPNNEGEEDCVQMKSNGAWNDISCSILHKAICKRGW